MRAARGSRQVPDGRDGRLEAALAAFDAAPALDPADLFGRWRGEEVPTGHPMDGLLRTYRWWGKEFRGPDDVDPLLFVDGRGRVKALDPWRLPVPGAAGHLVPRSAALGRLSARFHPLLSTSRPRARLRPVATRGVLSAAMVYDHLPIIDHFRGETAGSVLGLMDRRGDETPFCFRLCRADG